METHNKDSSLIVRLVGYCDPIRCDSLACLCGISDVISVLSYKIEIRMHTHHLKIVILCRT